jgi:SNF2 family DNA or RNA helicase
MRPNGWLFNSEWNMLVHKESSSLLLRVQDVKRITEILPDKRYRPIDFKGHNLAVRHGLDEIKILNNIGIKAPSPILYYYDWPGKYKPMAHQRDTAARLTIHRRMHVLNQAGTAKTACALWAADYLISIGAIRKVLVVAKLSTLERVWMEEIFSVLMHRTSSLLYGTRAKRIERLGDDVDFYVVNHEGVKILRHEINQRDDIDLIILDEASDYRNASTDKYKALASILKPEMRFWSMTATPCPNYPTDAWAQARLVSPSKVPEYFGTFRRQTMYQVNQFKWAPKTAGFEIAYEALQPAVRYKKSECMDLPAIITKERQAQLSKEQSKAFKDMVNGYVMKAKSGEKVTAVNAADRVNKLLQVFCGSVKNTDTGEYLTVDYKNRFEVLLECIQEADAKVIVIVPFKGIIYDLQKKISKYYSCEILNGDVSPKKRNDIVTRFKTCKNPHVLACHPKVMAHGLNLTEADTTIFYAPINSNDEAMQVVERFNRPGQVRKMTIVRIGAHKLEWDRYASLDGREKGQASMLSMYNNLVS